MARDTADDTPLEGRAALIEALSEGCKPKEAWRIGTEHEKFGFYTEDYSPVPYEGERGVKALLDGMKANLDWEGIYDHEHIIGLIDPVGGGAISLEPGGQFELSGAPLETLHQTCREVHGHLAHVREISDALGIGFLGLGASPKWSLEETPQMPKSRYNIMRNYMPKVGTHGLDMMHRTCTIQVNLDFESEADMVRKIRVGLSLQAVATALFANSPFLDSKPNGFLSYRGEIWRDVDNNRSGLMPFAFDQGFGFEQYVDYALDIPMYFIKRGVNYIDATSITFREYMNGKRPAGAEKETVTQGDWKNHLSTVFPDVRLKSFLEMRGADGNPWRRICALPAFWVGLLYDEDTLAETEDYLADWTDEERQTMRDTVPKTALNTPFRRGTVLDVAKRVVTLSHQGLRRRSQLNGAGFDEGQYLTPIDETVASGKTPAEIMLGKYHGEWGGNIDRVFDDFAY
ncbi:MAG: glutamate--cysteine ligase [Alphaproteobacteria bacterium]|nr:glutamate--cysteine ligase [Alphaproteobacteria bacterium]